MSAVIESRIGPSAMPLKGWPSFDLEGLFEALKRWPLDTRMDFSKEPEFASLPGTAPFRGRAWGHCVWQYSNVLQRRVAVATRPIYPEFPDAVCYCGNFLGYSFPFRLSTSDEALIARLDQAIAENLRSQN